MKLSDLKNGDTFKLATSDNVCIFIKQEIPKNQIRKMYFYECANSGTKIETYNDYEVIGSCIKDTMEKPTRKDFLVQVMNEIEQIKEIGKPEEIKLLNKKRFRHSKIFNCIYGQMTGFYMSYRAKEISPKVYCTSGLPIGTPYISFEEHHLRKGNDSTALELYLYMTDKVVHHEIIDYIKGERENIFLK